MDVRIVVNNNSKVPLLAKDSWGGTQLLFPGEKKQFVNGETTTVSIFRLCPTSPDSQYTLVRKHTIMHPSKHVCVPTTGDERHGQ